MRTANERRRYNVTSSFIGWAHAQYDSWCTTDISRNNLIPHKTDQINITYNKVVATWVPFQYKDNLFRYGISIVKIRLSWDRLILTIGIPILIPESQHFFISLKSYEPIWNLISPINSLFVQVLKTWSKEISFLHAKPWIPGGDISIFTAVIHWWRSPLHQFARARTIDEYDITMPVSYIRVTSQINCGDVTILNQKRLSLATMAKSAIDNCFSRIVCSGHQIV